MTSTIVYGRILSFALIFLLSIYRPAYADHGACPCLQSSLPTPVTLAEPRQRAIILWNGTRELLVLSTDVVSDAPDPHSVAEFIPVPSEPSIASAQLDVFENANSFYSAVTHETGPFVLSAAHGAAPSNPAARELQDANELPAFLSRTCVIDHRYQEAIIKIADAYIERRHSWFATDSILVDANLRSFPPIAYTFASSRFYYPLETSIIASGETNIDILAITPHGLTAFEPLSTDIATSRVNYVPTSRLAQIATDWPGFFDRDEVAIQHLALTGKLSDMTRDLISN